MRPCVHGECQNADEAAGTGTWAGAAGGARPRGKGMGSGQGAPRREARGRRADRAFSCLGALGAAALERRARLRRGWREAWRTSSWASNPFLLLKGICRPAPAWGPPSWRPGGGSRGDLRHNARQHAWQHAGMLPPHDEENRSRCDGVFVELWPSRNCSWRGVWGSVLEGPPVRAQP